MSQPRIVALWSAPRCRSTAFLRMVAERGDFTVVHEPFSQLADFGSAQVGPRTVTDVPAAVAALRDLAGTTPVFFKDTTDFAQPELLSDREFLAEVAHAFVVRDPEAAIASHFALNPDLTRDEVGFSRLADIFDAVRDLGGREPFVFDADDLLEWPEGLVCDFCDWLGVEFLPHALSWQPGMLTDWRATSRWHEATSSTAGFAAPRRNHAVDVRSHPVLSGYLDHHLPHFRRLSAHCRRPAGDAHGLMSEPVGGAV